MRRLLLALVPLLALACSSAAEQEQPARGPCWEGALAHEPGGSVLHDAAAPFAYQPLQTEVQLYELTMSPADLAAMNVDVEDDTMRPATFTYAGQSQPVQVRYRGNSSRDWPKKSWRIEFPDDVRVDGRNKINLVSEWKDETMMVEKLGYDMLAAMGLPAPNAKFVRFSVNGAYQGVYLDLERVDKDWLRNHHFADDDATIYRCGRKDCEMKTWLAEFQQRFEKKTNESEGDGALDGFICALNQAPEPLLADTLDRNLELELYLRSMAMDALLSNDVIEDSRSYLVLDGFTRRWLYMPWDLNNSSTRYQPGSNVGTHAKYTHPLFIYSATDGWSEDKYVWRMSDDPTHDWHPLFSDLSTRILFQDDLRQRLFATTERALDELFDPSVIDGRIQAIHDLLRPFMANDPYIELDKFDDGPRYLQEYVVNRTAFVRAQLDAFRQRTPGLVIEAVDPAAGWVELANRGATPIELKGMSLTNNLRQRPLQPNLEGSLSPGEVKRMSLGLQPAGELGIYSTPGLSGLTDLFFYGELPKGKLYRRSLEGRWEIR